MTIDALAADLRTSLRGVVEVDKDIARLTTYRVGGRAAVYVEPAVVEDLNVVAEALARAGGEQVPVLALGRGSNVVISDRGFPGVVVHLSGAFAWTTGTEAREQPARAGVRAGAATSLPLLANWAARRGLEGVEFMVAIPGSVGGGVRMNAGAHGGEMRDHLVEVGVFDVDRNKLESRPASALELSYRTSNLTDRELVVDALLDLPRADKAAIKARMDDYRRHRTATQPGAAQNAGSVFKNPPGDSAGRLVEAAGCKGLRVGHASVSELHANFFIAHTGATGREVFELVASVRRRVLERFGVDLEPEIRFVGSFETNDAEVSS